MTKYILILILIIFNAVNAMESSVCGQFEPDKDLIFLLTQLSTYIKSGITLVDSLNILIRQVKHSVSTLLNCGVKISDEEILAIIADEIKNERMRKIVGKSDVKKKFKDMMSDYLESTQNYL